MDAEASGRLRVLRYCTEECRQLKFPQSRHSCISGGKNSMDKWMKLGPFTVFDLETTGMSPIRDRIVEIGAVRIEVDGTLSQFETLVNPNKLKCEGATLKLRPRRFLKTIRSIPFSLPFPSVCTPCICICATFSTTSTMQAVSYPVLSPTNHHKLQFWETFFLLIFVNSLI